MMEKRAEDMVHEALEGGGCSVPKAEPHCKACLKRNCNYVL